MKILFIGNSHTYMNDMPELARRMIEDASGENCDVFMLAYSGRSLKWHIETEYFSERFNILRGNYDCCVIQEQAHPLPPEEDTIAAFARLDELCKKAGTTPVLFETWAEKAMPEHQEEMNRRYRSLAEKHGCPLAPIGEVWAKALPELDRLGSDLYFRDGEHASPLGDYLIAMTLTKAMTGKLPDPGFLNALDFTVPGRFFPLQEDVDKEERNVSKEEAEIIRRCVESVI